MGGHMQVSQPPSLQALRDHYDIERELSDRLRNARPEERRTLYSAVYDEFHQRVTHLRYLGLTQAVEDDSALPSRGMKLVERYLTPESVFLEIGAGDCSFSREVSAHVTKVYAVDVSELAMRNGGELPPNVEPVVSGGIDIPVPNGSVDVAFSSNLIEHLHPDDAFEQTRNVFDALKPGGIYICVTPNRIYGPHDVSGEFGDPVATGFHLKEYTYGDIVPFFERVGFRNVKGYLDLRGRIVTPFPPFIAQATEALLGLAPARLRLRAMNPMPIRALLFVRVIGTKP
jgi:SAM-dependent methyltransferase